MKGILGGSEWPRGLGRRSAACWDCGFESRRQHGCLSVVSVVCCQVEVVPWGRSLSRAPIASMCLSMSEIRCDSNDMDLQ